MLLYLARRAGTDTIGTDTGTDTDTDTAGADDTASETRCEKKGSGLSLEERYASYECIKKGICAAVCTWERQRWRGKSTKRENRVNKLRKSEAKWVKCLMGEG